MIGTNNEKIGYARVSAVTQKEDRQIDELTAGTAGATAKAICEIPSFAMLQVAKFEVAVKEIILNEYKNVELAKKIIANYVEMATQIKKDALLTFDKKEMKNKKKSAEYAEKSCEELSKFVSAFENGKRKL